MTRLDIGVTDPHHYTKEEMIHKRYRATASLYLGEEEERFSLSSQIANCTAAISATECWRLEKVEKIYITKFEF